jgi:membrane protein DedA with SNARE-associated domain
VSDWIVLAVRRGGLGGVALLMVLENVFPPIPSEVVMPLAGVEAARGSYPLALAIAAGTAGSVVGALLWYALGRALGAERIERWAARHGRWLTLEPSDVRKATQWFERHCGKAVVLGRLVPAVRTLISLPAGLAHMPLTRFVALTSVGTTVWSGLLAWAGFALGEEYGTATGWLSTASNIIVGGALLWYLWRVATFRKRQPGAA